MYRRLLLNLFCSFIIMYGVMFLNVDSLSHIHLSLTRMYMALLMVAPMAVLMIVMMRKMYKEKRKNIIILLTSSLVFILALIGLRGQVGIGDVQYMKAMIPHHSSALLTSKNADIDDPEVKKLSIQIIKAQEEEIALMEDMISRLEK